jgi:hypothetical protein
MVVMKRVCHRTACRSAARRMAFIDRDDVRVVPETKIGARKAGRLLRVLDGVWRLCSRANPYHARGDDAKRTDYFRGVIVKRACNNPCFRSWRKSFEPNQDHTRCNTVQAKDQFTEVFIDREQDGLAVIGLLQDLIIADTRRQFRNIDNILVVRAEAFYNLAIHAFIGHKIHAALSVTG